MKCEFRIYLDEINAKKFDKQVGWYSCPSEGKGITRTHLVCNTHFTKLKDDNKIRHERGIDITEDMMPLKLTKRFVNKLQLDENQESN
jgi:hypothetical protein